jgi:hypothetical protein
LDSPAIQKAIEECHRTGGGTVQVPPGHYRCGTLRLRARTCLDLAMGAVIESVDDVDQFPFIRETPYGNLPGNIRALIVAEEVDEIAVTGLGVLDGGGRVAPTWHEAKPLKFRPALCFLRDCRSVRFENVTLKDTRFWSLHLMRCETVAIRGVKIECNPAMPNSDGIDPDGCRNMIISDCDIRTGDDAIVIKSTEGDVCENITIANCIVSSRCAALKLGTESVGSMRNILFNNCVVRDSHVGLALYMKDGSLYENVTFSNVVAEVDNPFPLLIDITPRYYRDPKKGDIRNVLFQNVTVTGPGRCLIEGLPDRPVENVRFENLTWNITGPCEPGKHAKPNGAARIELDPNRINPCVAPYQFLCLHARGIRARGVNLRYLDPRQQPDRGVFHFNGVQDVRVSDVVHGALPEGIPAVHVVDSQGVQVEPPGL